jgi:multiple sugar transport system permease protein
MLLPWIIPGVIVAGVWKWMLHSQSGIINRYIVDLGIIEQGFPFLGTPGTALFTVAFVIVWRLFPLFALVVVASIHNIDVQLFESGKIDGMNKWQEIWNITLPSIRYQVLTMSLLNLIWITNNLVLVSIMTKGGPMYYSTTLPLFMYQLGIQFGKLSQASAATMINFLILLVWGLLYFYIYRRNQLRG